MKRCIVDGVEVSANLIRANCTAFGKKIDANFAIPFCLELDANDVVADFGSYYQEFIERESEDEGFEEVLDGIYLKLAASGYLPLKKMISEQPEMLAELIIDELPAEFLGYIFLDCDASVESKKYILQSLESVSIVGEKITCAGHAF